MTVRHQTLTCLLLFGDSGWTQGKAEAEVDNAVPRRATAPDRRPAVRGIEDPTAATEHAAQALPWSNGIADCTLGIFTVPVATPFREIPMHVIKPPSVCLLLSDGVRLTVAVSIKPSIVAQ